uniref:Uncharacterized protein n=1 Tax=Cacopsylla melanoneura TaxID=428564 RepID=A0A8D8LD68_9HEMI
MLSTYTFLGTSSFINLNNHPSHKYSNDLFIHYLLIECTFLIKKCRSISNQIFNYVFCGFDSVVEELTYIILQSTYTRYCNLLHIKIVYYKGYNLLDKVTSPLTWPKSFKNIYAWLWGSNPRPRFARG